MPRRARRPRPVRRNSDDDMRAAERRFYDEGTDEALFSLIQQAMRHGSLLGIPAEAFIRAVSKDPMLLRSLPPQALEDLTRGVAIASAVHVPGNWFPDHTPSNVCPRGHRFEDLVEVGARRVLVAFTLMESGVVTASTVSRATTDDVVVDLGTEEDTQRLSEYTLLCDVCSAQWPQVGDLQYE